MKHFTLEAAIEYYPDNPEWLAEWLANLADTLGYAESHVNVVYHNDNMTGAALMIEGYIVVTLVDGYLLNLHVATNEVINRQALYNELEYLNPASITTKFLDYSYARTTVM